MAEEARQALGELNKKLEGLFPYRLELVNPKEIKLLDKNARYMTNEMFQNLVENIKNDGNDYVILKESDVLAIIEK